MTGRDERGRFVAGHPFARLGGLARAAALTPERRSEIARLGFAALTAQRFGGRRRKCAAWLFDPLGYRQP